MDSLVSIQNKGPEKSEWPAAKISSLLIKPASALCNLDCEYCFYLDRGLDPYKDVMHRTMSQDTLRKLVESYLFYSYPHSVFAFQGGEPTLAGLPFFEKLVEFQKRFGRSAQFVSNALQTNGILIDDAWCQFLRQYQWLVGISMDGNQQMHDTYRRNRGGEGTWKKVMRGIERMTKHKVDFNVLCVISQTNVHQPEALYEYFQQLGVEYLQFIPLAEFTPTGQLQPYAITAQEYGDFLVRLFDRWWPDHQHVRIRFFDNLAEAVAGYMPGNCVMHERCESYAVVEYNGDVYPCDFYVEPRWLIGNLHRDSWNQIAATDQRLRFARGKQLPHAECMVCQYQKLCHRGCPAFREKQRGNPSDLDYFCATYKRVFDHCLPKLRLEVAKITGKQPVH